MKSICVFSPFGALVLLAGCADVNSVLFVTDTSLGINLEGKPPTVSIAYDRTEGYFAPRYENGGIPPVVATVGVGGGIFNPRIRQVYATGAAAVKAVKTPNPDDGPKQLTGDLAKRRMAFFGTSTTIGAKIGFSGGAGPPDSFIFGYRRKEMSYLPLGCKGTPSQPPTAQVPPPFIPCAPTGSGNTDVYPSVLASIDSTLNADSLQGTGLDSIQFFATGEAAETLAKNPIVSGAFELIAQNSAQTSLTPEEKQQVAENVTELKNIRTDRAGSLRNYLNAQTNVPEAWSELLDKANTYLSTNVSDGSRLALRNAKSTDEIIGVFLGLDDDAQQTISNGIPVKKM